MEKFDINQAKKVREKIIEISRKINEYLEDGSRAFTRQGKLTAERLIMFMLSLSGKSLKESLSEFYMNHVPGRLSTMPTASAFIRKRKHLDDRLFRDLFLSIEEDMKQLEEDGLTILACDGSDLAIAYDAGDPDAAFLNKDGHKFNLLHINALFNVTSGTFVDVEIIERRKSYEVDALNTMMQRRSSKKKALILADRGYGYYTTMMNISSGNDYFLLRVCDPGPGSILSPDEFPRDTEFDIEREVYVYQKTKIGKSGVKRVSYQRYHETESRKDKDLKQLKFRVVASKLKNGKVVYLATNLDKDKYPPEKIVALYRRRWSIETAFRRLKYDLAMNYCRTQKKKYVKMEIYARLINYNFTARMVYNAEQRRKKREKKKAKRSVEKRFQCQCNFKKAIPMARYSLLSRTITRKDFNFMIERISMETQSVREDRLYPRKSHRISPRSHMFSWV